MVEREITLPAKPVRVVFTPSQWVGEGGWRWGPLSESSGNPGRHEPDPEPPTRRGPHRLERQAGGADMLRVGGQEGERPARTPAPGHLAQPGEQVAELPTVADAHAVRRIGDEQSWTGGRLDRGEGRPAERDVEGHPGALRAGGCRRDGPGVAVAPRDRRRRPRHYPCLRLRPDLAPQLRLERRPPLEREGAPEPGGDPPRKERRLDRDGAPAAR